MKSVPRSGSAVGATVLVLFLLSTSASGGPPTDVWGIKSNGPLAIPSSPPTRLFRFPIAGGPLVDLGALTVAGAPIDADALVVLPSGALRAFRLSTAGSQLIDIPPTRGPATEIGSVLAARDIRAAVALSEDELLAIDVQTDELLRIDAQNGGVLGAAITLTRGCVPAGLVTSCGLAMNEDGLLIVVDSNEYLTLSPTTGRLQRLFVDSAPIPPNPTVSFTGIAFGGGAEAQTLYSYEINGPDDIVSYDLDDDFARTMVHANILPAFNAGRGEIATWIDATPIEPPPGPVGDLNGDGVVDGADLGILLNAWGPCPGCCVDLNGDGVVDGADLGILLNSWG